MIKFYIENCLSKNIFNHRKLLNLLSEAKIMHSLIVNFIS